MKIQFDLQPFKFPNYLHVTGLGESTIGVGQLTHQQAAEYWDEMKSRWLNHVKERAKAELELLNK